MEKMQENVFDKTCVNTIDRDSSDMLNRYTSSH